MSEILIASCPPVGHISPLLNVARGLVAYDARRVRAPKAAAPIKD